MTPAGDAWYRDAIVYEVAVRGFFDGNGDGIGDLAGLTRKLDYLVDLGVTAVWLLPFYPSPMRDGGYDIADYRGVAPEYGSLGDFRAFVRAAHERGLRVITELVLNHTSDQHRWFQRARAARPGSATREMYLWSDTGSEYADARVIFRDAERSNWTWDPVAGAHYWHRFFSHQPDLNYRHPRVRKEILRTVAFWLDLGVDGLRLDAVPYLFESEGTNCENLPETHAFLREIRRFVDERYGGDRVLLAEANQWPADAAAYFGDGDECHMNFHFPLMPRLFAALHQEHRHPVVDILEQTPPIPETAQWGLFLRNHDELTLEMVTDEERDYMYRVYATDPRMRLNLGIRRRLAPLLNNSRRAIELLNGLLFSLPGTPILYYGDEIGMGDNIYLGDRDGVRTPMQWTGDRNGGFSRADPARLYAPLVMDPLYGYQGVNVEAQERSPSSLLNWMRRMIALRRSHRVLARGSMEILEPANPAIVAFTRHFEGETVLVVANLSRFVQPAELDLAAFAGTVPVELIGGQRFPRVGQTPYFLSLAPHAFTWFRLEPVPEPAMAGDEGGLPAIEIDGDWARLFEGSARRTLEEALVPRFLERRPWLVRREDAGRPTELAGRVRLDDGATPCWLTFWSIPGAEDAASAYVLPLAVATGRHAARVRREAPDEVIAEVVAPRGRGLLFDGMADGTVAADLLEMFRRGRTRSGDGGRRLAAPRERGFREVDDALEEEPSTHPLGHGPETSRARIGGCAELTLYRRVEPGPHPAIEAGRHLERVDLPHPAARLVGWAEIRSAAEEATVVAALHEVPWHEASARDVALREARRRFEALAGETAIALPPALGDGIVDLAGYPLPPEVIELAPQFFGPLETLGRRVAELHLALADHETAPVVRELEPDLPAGSPADLPPELRDRIEHAVDRAATGGDAARERGDLDLDGVLWVENDFVITGFEGDVHRPLADRRQPAPPLGDLVRLIESFRLATFEALDTVAAERPAPELVAERLAPWAVWWQRWIAAAILRGYLGTRGVGSLLGGAAELDTGGLSAPRHDGGR